MDSDESYETTSEVFREGDSEPTSSGSQTSVNRDSTELRELYASTFSGPEPPVLPAPDNQIGSLTAKIKEQTLQIQSLKEERIKYLEKITQLYTALEKRESELVEFIQSYEQKANDVAQYMQEVQGLLAQLTTLFPDQLAESNTIDELDLSCTTTTTTSTTTSTAASPNTTSNSLVASVTSNGTNGPSQTPCLTADKSIGAENQSATNGCESSGQTGWDQRGRALLHALSASVATASARNKQATLPRNTEPTVVGSHLPIAEVPPRPAMRLINLQASKGLTKPSKSNGSSTESNCPDGPEVTVCNLPPFCWSTEHVLYWLTEYACLPGGCIAAAKRLQLDGKQLTALCGNKADKLLCLSDAGLRRKFQLALEDLRVHGPPGVSRFPGPSHVRPQWICDVWLRHHLGLSQLAPLFAVRRIDGRLLASLAIYKRTHGRTHTTSLAHRNSRTQLISSPSELISSPSVGSSLPGTPLPVNGSHSHPSSGLGDGKADRSGGSNWRGASRKEFHRILLGLGRDASSVSASCGGGGISGADLPPEAKLLLGKREACSLRAGIELLRQYNFNIELLEQARSEAESANDNLLVWTNDQVAKWLKDLGLKAFTEGIDGTGLHGAYMVLDPTFDVTRLMKLLHLPASVATAHKLDEHLQTLLKPARQREGIQPKQHSIFRRRSISRPGRANLMQRSITSSSPMDYTSASTPLLTSNLGPDQGQTDRGHNGQSFNQNGSGLEGYPRTMPANSSFITVLNSLNPSLSRTLNGSSQLLFISPTQGSVSGTPKRGKFKSVTVNGDLSNSRFTRVFCRGRATGQSGSNGHSAGLGSPVSGGHSLVTGPDEHSATSVRRSSAQTTSTASESIRSPVVSKFSTPTSSPRHHLEPQKSTPVRGAVKPSEAPMVDPFAQDGGRARMRVVLGQTPRLTTLTAASGCTSPPSVVGTTTSPAAATTATTTTTTTTTNTTDTTQPVTAVRDPANPASVLPSSPTNPSPSVALVSAEQRAEPSVPINSMGKLSVRLATTAAPEPSPTSTLSSLSLSCQSNLSVTKPSMLPDRKTPS